MKIILDEGVPEPLARHLSGHVVRSVDSMGWKGTTNGKLLRLIESVDADVFITADKNIQSQQDLTERPFATLLLSTNSWPLIRLHLQAVREALREARPHSVVPVDCGSFTPMRFRLPTT